MKTPILLFCAILALGAGLGACINLTGFMDKPSGDAQLLSAARACLDNQDYECARKYYNQLSGNQADIKQSELAYTMLDENGAGMDAFITGFGSGNGGDGLTSFANSLVFSSNRGTTTRGNIQSAYLMAYENGQNNISDSNTRNLVRFISAISLAAEILAEAASSSGLQKSDLVTNPAGCNSVANASCAAGGSLLLKSAAGPNLDTISTSTIESDSLSLGLFYSAIAAADDALTQLGVSSGKFKTGTLTFFDQFSTYSALMNTNAGDESFRYLLISNGVGQ